MYDPTMYNFDEACANGDTPNAMKYWKELKGIYKPTYKDLECKFISACSGGNLSLAQWMLKVKPKLNIFTTNYASFRWACENGRLDVAQWLFSLNPKWDMSSYTNQMVFLNACSKGHLSMVQWLSTIRVGIKMDYHGGFYLACHFGRLSVAQWILNEKPDIIDVLFGHDNYGNHALQLACYYDQLPVAQWLLSIHPDMDVSIVDKSRVSNEEILALLEEQDLPKFKGAVKR